MRLNVNEHGTPVWVTARVWPPTVIFAARALVEELGPMLKVKGAAPDPVVGIPEAGVIQPAPGSADQPQPPEVLRVKLIGPPVAATDVEEAESPKVQPVPTWLILILWPPKVRVLERDTDEALAAIRRLMVAVPLPPRLGVPPASVTKLTGAAVHGQPLLDADSATGRVPPPPGAENAVGVKVKLQAVPNWVTWKVSPAMVSVALRVAADGLASAV